MQDISSFTDLIGHCRATGREDIIPELQCLKGSYSTLEYNHVDFVMEYSDHLRYREEDISELTRRVLPVFQCRLHNYITSSYSFSENVETAVSRFGGNIRATYENEFYETPEEKAMRGLRIYAQHHRVLPLEIERTDVEVKYPDLNSHDFKNLVLIDVNDLVASKQDWNEDAQKYFFESDGLESISEDMKLDVVEVVDAHHSLSQGFYNWLFDALCERLSAWPDTQKNGDN